MIQDTVTVEIPSASSMIVRVVGEVDMIARPSLMQALDRAVLSGADVVVDLTGVTFMYSGADALVTDAVRRADGRVRVVAPTGAARAPFEMLGEPTVPAQ